jgi:hypothetical protein
MANGVNVTDKGMQFLVSIDGSEAMNQLRLLQTSMKGLASEIEKSVGLTQKTFNKTFDSLGELVKELDKNPGVGIPGAASKDAAKFSQKLNQELEKQRKKMNEGFVEARQGLSDLNKETNILSNSVDGLGDDVKDANKSLSEMIDLGPTLKGAFAGLAAAFGFSAIYENAVELDELFLRLSQRFSGAGADQAGMAKTISAVAKSAESAEKDVGGLVLQLNALGIVDKDLAAGMADLSVKISRVFGTTLTTAANSLKEFRNMGIVKTKDDMKEFASVLSTVQENFGGTYDELSNSISGVSEQLRGYVVNLMANKVPEAEAIERGQQLAASIAATQRVFKEFNREDLGNQVANAIAKININPLNVELTKMQAALKEIGEEDLFENAKEQLAAGDPTGFLELFEKLSTLTEEQMTLLPPEYLNSLFGNQFDARELINTMQQLKAASRDISEEIEKQNRVTKEQQANATKLDEGYEKWKKTVGGASEVLGKTFERIFNKIALIAAEPMTWLIEKFNSVLVAAEELFTWIGKNETAMAGLNVAIKTAFSVATFAVAITAIGKVGLAIRGLKGAIGLISGLWKNVFNSKKPITDAAKAATEAAKKAGKAIPSGIKGVPKSGGAVAGLMGAAEVYGSYSEEGSFFNRNTLREASGAAGAVIGAIGGAVAGTAVMPFGGGFVGSGVGAYAGESIGENLFDAVANISDNFSSGSDEDPAKFSRSVSPRARANRSMSRASAMYQPKDPPMVSTSPEVPTNTRAAESFSPQSSGSTEAVVEKLDRLIHVTESQTQVINQGTQAQLNSTRVGGNPSAALTQLNNLGNGAN